MTLTILLIDDDPRLLQTLARNLELADHHPLIARSGQEGLALYVQKQPDLVMLDLRMPDMSGEAVLQAIRHHNPHADVVLVTAHGEREEIVAALRLGASDIIFKPVEDVTVEHALRRAEARIALRQELESTQAALQKSESCFRSALENSPIIVAHTDRDLRYTWAYNTFPGTTEAEIVGRTDDELLTSEGARALMALKRGVLDSGESARGEVLWRGDGTTTAYDVLVNPMRDAEGHLTGVTLAAVDITERKATEEALRRERDLLNRLMETSPLGITVVDRAGQITFANRPAEQILGLSRDEITARTYNDPGWQITDEQGGPIPDADLPFAQVMATGEPVYNARHAITWADGRRVLILMNGAPLTNALGELDGVVFTLEDVTQRVAEDERRIQELQRELESLTILASAPATQITARMFGVRSLHEALPEVFAALSQRYGDVLEQAIEQRLYHVKHTTSDALRELAQSLGNLLSGPRDVMEIHTSVLQEKCMDVNSIKARAYAAEGRLLALELMGYLVSYYRTRCPITPNKEPEDGGRHA